MPSQQLQGQLQTQHSVDTCTNNHIMGEHNLKSKSNERWALEENQINAKKYANKQSNNDNNNNNNNFTNTNLRFYWELRNVKYKYVEIIIQFNSNLYYLCAEPTATRPITDTAQRR
jgi:hypothetical protein